MPDNDERHREQDRRAKRVRDREAERQKRRKDGIPLWAYSKVLEYWIPTLIATWGLTESVVNVCNYDTPNWTIKVWLWAWTASSYYGALKTVFKWHDMQREAQEIKGKFTKYLSSEGHTLKFSDDVKDKWLMRVVIDHVIKYEPGVFDKFSADITSVKDPDVVELIIKAQLKYRPWATESKKIIDGIVSKEIVVSDSIYNMAKKCQARLANTKPR